jgi:hypothetical protein
MPGRKLIVVAALAGLAGCGRSGGGPAPQPQAVVAAEPEKPVPAVAALVPSAVAVQPVAKPQPPAEPFRFPDDAGGKKVSATLAPAAPPAPPLPGGGGPRPRTTELDRGEVPPPPVTATVPPLPLPVARPPRPTPPPERVPADLGRLAAEDPSKVRLPERPRARGEVAANAASPDLPPLTRQLPDRAPTDDPTAEIAAARAVLTALPLPVPAGWFAKFGIPDPFEFAAQMRGKTAADGELGTKPVTIPPDK